MAERRSVGIFGTGHYAPERVMENAEFESFLDTSDEWIRQRTGIERRHIATDEQIVSDLAANAAREALEMAGWAPETVEFVLVGTCFPDHMFPNSAQRVAKLIGCPNSTGAIDVLSACSSWVYGLTMVTGQLAAGQFDRAIVIGAEKMSALLNWKDRNSAIIFGDGAGAVAIGVSEPGGSEVLATHLGADYDSLSLVVPAGGAAYPHDPDPVKHKLIMHGHAVYKFAVNTLVSEMRSIVKKAGLTFDDIDWLLPHQVNRRIIESAVAKLDWPLDRTIINVHNYGNTSAASVPMALDEAVRAGRVKRGDIVAACAFGAGLSWGSVAFRF